MFDVGETLVDETPTWEAVADAAGVMQFTFMAALGGLIAAGRSHRESFDPFGVSEPATLPALEPDDVYPMRVPALSPSARSVSGRDRRQRARSRCPVERVIGVELDFVATSAAWGVAGRRARSSSGSPPSWRCRPP